MAQKYVSYSPTTGALTGFYDTVDSPVPSGATVVAITNAQWQTCLSTPGYMVVSGALVAPSSSASLVSAQTAQINAFSIACRTAITSGFTSSALGSAHSYPSMASDQQNLTDAMNASLVSGLPSNWTTLLWCAAAGVWSFTAHTVAQVQQVHSDWITYRITQQQLLATLTAQVNAATSTTALAAIVW